MLLLDLQLFDGTLLPLLSERAAVRWQWTLGAMFQSITNSDSRRFINGFCIPSL